MIGIYKNDTLFLLCEEYPIDNPWGYTIQELRDIEEIRTHLKKFHAADPIDKDIDEFIRDGWFYNRNPKFQFVP